MDEPAELRIECEPLGLGTRARLIVRQAADNAVLDVDTLDLGRAADRTAYARRAASLLPWPRADFERELLRIAEARVGQRKAPETPGTLSQAIDLWASHKDEPKIPTGFSPLDGLFGGGLLHASITVLAGLPGCGKSALALQAMLGATIADPELRAVWGLGEMSREQLARRAVTVGSALLGAPAVTMEQSGRREDNARAVADELKRDIGDRITIVSPLTIEGIEHGVITTGARLVIVDYLQLVRVDGAADRRQEVDAVVRAIREMAVARGLAVIAVCNIAKGVTRDSRAGSIGKESNEIDYAGDTILLGDPDEDVDENGLRPVRWRCLKNRHGPQDHLETIFDGGLQLFTSDEAPVWPEFVPFADRGRP
jgi:replicative DNA helicase